MDNHMQKMDGVKLLGREVVTSSIVSPYVTNASTTGAMTAISSTSKHPEKAMELINLVNTDSTLRNLLMFGIEGTHYEKVSDNQIKRDPNGPYSVTSGPMETYLTLMF